MTTFTTRDLPFKVVTDPDDATSTFEVNNQGQILFSGSVFDASEFAALEGVTAGTITADKAVIVDSSKDVSIFGTVGVTNLDAGASGVAGTVDVFPTTATSGNYALIDINA